MSAMNYTFNLATFFSGREITKRETNESAGKQIECVGVDSKRRSEKLGREIKCREKRAEGIVREKKIERNRVVVVAR